MVIPRKLVLALTLCAGSAWADRCIPEGWRQLEGPISNQWCVGTFKYDGGAVAYYVNFRNDSPQAADVSCDVWYDGGQKSYVGGTLHAGQTLRDGGNYVIARHIERSRCNIKWKQ